MKLESPKTRFRKSNYAREHSELVDTPVVLAALDATLLQMEYMQGTATDMGTAAAKHYLIEGGRKFRDTFLLLTADETEEFKRNPDSLPHTEI